MANAQDFFIDGAVGKLAVRAKGLEARPDQVVVMVQGSNLTGQSMFGLARDASPWSDAGGAGCPAS